MYGSFFRPRPGRSRMLRGIRLLSVWVLAVTTATAAPPGLDPQDEEKLKEAKLPLEGPPLLDHLRKQVLTPEQLQSVPGHIRKLGDDAFRVREKASADLLTLGPGVIP